MGAQNARYLRSWHLYIGSILHVFITFTEKAAPFGCGKKPPPSGGGKKPLHRDAAKSHPIGVALHFSSEIICSNSSSRCRPSPCVR